MILKIIIKLTKIIRLNNISDIKIQSIIQLYLLNKCISAP